MVAEIENKEEKAVTEKAWRVFETVILVIGCALVVAVIGMVMYLAFGWQIGGV
ncbi:hypothetical protein ES705_40823 [subsurface metagenome]